MGSPVFVKKGCRAAEALAQSFVFSSFAGVAVLGGSIFADHFYGQK